MDDLIRRQLAIDALRNYLVGKNVPCDGTLTCRLIENEVINKLPSAESESYEWCTDCKEYDQEAHCCHRWSKMIRKTVEEMQIVHCSECKWFQCNVRPDGYLPKGIDEFQCNHWDRSCDPTDYCSFAERREDAKLD